MNYIYAVVALVGIQPLVYLFGRYVGYKIGFRYGTARGWNQATSAAMRMQQAELEAKRKTLERFAS